MLIGFLLIIFGGYWFVYDINNQTTIQSVYNGFTWFTYSVPNTSPMVNGAYPISFIIVGVLLLVFGAVIFTDEEMKKKLYSSLVE